MSASIDQVLFPGRNTTDTSHTIECCSPGKQTLLSITNNSNSFDHISRLFIYVQFSTQRALNSLGFGGLYRQDYGGGSDKVVLQSASEGGEINGSVMEGGWEYMVGGYWHCAQQLLRGKHPWLGGRQGNCLQRGFSGVKLKH